MAKRKKHIRMFEEELQQLKEWKRRQYGDNADDVPHAAAVTALIEDAERRHGFL